MPKAKPVQGIAPKLRFSRFKSEWKLKNLGEICDMQAGKFIPASDIYEVERSGLYPCFGGNGLRGYAETYTHDGKFPLIGRQGALCGNVTLVDGKFHATEHAVVASPKQDVVVDWLYYMLDRLNLNRFATGQAQPGLSVEVLERVHCWKPLCEAEQQSIADCLSFLDAYIETETHKLDALKAHKQGLMQQLFPAEGQRLPRLRFPGFEGVVWEVKPLRDVCRRITNGKANAEDHEEDGIYPLFDRSETIKKSGDYLFEGKAVILPGEGMRFQPRYYEGKFNLHQRAYALMEFQEESRFVFYALDCVKNEIARRAVKSTVLSLRLPIIEGFEIFVSTSHDEQQKIADCLSSLDGLIESQAGKIVVLQRHKKGLMQGLFPAMNTDAA